MRKYLLKAWLIPLFLIGACSFNFAQTAVFTETFDEATGTFTGFSEENIGWNAICSFCTPSGVFGVNASGTLEANDTNGPATWETFPIDISSCLKLAVSIDYSGEAYSGLLDSSGECGACAGLPATSNTGDCFECWDFTQFELLLDNSVSNDLLIGTTYTPTSTTAEFNTSICGVTQAALRVTMQNNVSNEFQNIDNVVVLCYDADDLVISGNDAVCDSDDQSDNFAEIYSIDPIIPGDSYEWSTNGGTPSMFTTGTSFGVNWFNETPGTYTVSVEITDAFGCITTVDKTVYVITSTPEAIACAGDLNITLNTDCSLGVLTPDMFLEDMQYTNDAYEMEITDANGDLVDLANGGDYLNETLTVKISSACNGNSCWTTVNVEDKYIPILECSTSETVDCEDVDANLGFPTNVGTPIANGDGTFTVLNYDNCGIATLSYTDFTTAQLCSHPTFSSIVSRTWLITDLSGNSSSCVTTININRASVADITFPAHWDPAFGTTAVDPCGNWPSLDNGNPHPDYTGTPQGDFCLNVTMSYYDDYFDGVCEREFKILRRWTIEDVCTGETREYTQNIQVAYPLNGFVVTCPPDLIIDEIPTNDFYNCTADWLVIPPNVIYLSNCLDYTWTVDHIIGDGSLDPPAGVEFTNTNVSTSGNTYLIEDLPVGRHWIRYTLVSDCGEIRYCFTELDVYDDGPPNAVCDLHTNIALNSEGYAYANPSTFDDGSFSCSEVTVLIRRVNSGNCSAGSQTSFTDLIEFCCDDANSTVLIELQATTTNGQTNTCIVEANIQDFTSSSFSDPSNTSVALNCGQSISLNSQSYLESQFGAPSFTPSLCGGSWNEVLPATMSRDDCGVGSIKRTWRYTNASGNVSYPTQTISISLNNAFDDNDITWPGDVDMSGCKTMSIAPEDLPISSTREPSWNTDDCSDIHSSYTDTPFYFIEGVCVKVLRKWTVIDWCQASNIPGSGQWNYTQVIKIDDSTAPSINSGCSLPTYVNGEDSSCGQIVSFSASASDNCPEELSWSASIDGGNQNIVFDNGEAQINDVSLDAGSHVICWYVQDVCGNTDECCESFQIRDNKPPTPACVTTLTTVISNPNSPTLIWASDFDASSTDNCSSFNQLSFAFSTNPSNQSIGFDCSDLANGVVDTIPLNIYVFDAAGNYDFCEAMLILQDNSDYCADVDTSPRISLSGDIMTENDDMLDEVMVNLSMDSGSTPLSYMAYDGLYAFDDLNMYNDYIVEASKNDDYMNGVSTIDLILIQKHILSVQLLDSPYKVIASDVNNNGKISAIDLIELRKLILGIYTELPNNDSWRFVDAQQSFPDIQSPFPFQEKISFNAMDTDVDDANFVAVKIGDVNDSAEANTFNVSTSNRNGNVVLDVAQIKASDNTLQFDLSSNQTQSLMGMQFTVLFDANAMTFKDIISESLELNEANFAQINEGVLTFSWSDINAKSIAQNANLLSLVFESTDDKGQISLASTVTKAEAYSIEDNTIVTKGIELRSNDSKSFALHQNVPNPFNANTVIGFELPESSKVNLTVYDATGKVIFAKSDEYSQGYNEVVIDGNALPSSGILYYQLDSYTHSATKKMILLK